MTALRADRQPADGQTAARVASSDGEHTADHSLRGWWFCRAVPLWSGLCRGDAGDVQQLLHQTMELASASRTKAGMEDAEIVIAAVDDEGVDTSGRVMLRELSAGSAQVVASVLAKSAVLGDY